MAAPNRILSLNLGMQTLSLAEFRTSSSGGLVLQQYRLTELMADPAADASRIAQMRIVIKEMTEALKVSGGKVNYSIPAQSVFTRFVKLPSVGEDKVDQIVSFEAQQNVPFPIDEVVWDYQLVDSGQESKMEVVLVAIKADLLDEINGAVEEAGLTTSVVDVGPMALYNAFRYNYSDMSGCSLLIDIGARTTNLIFVEPKKVFSRSIPIGGSTITAAIAKDSEEPFGAAEERKKSVGFVSLGGAYAEPSDPDVARVSKMIRNTMTRLHSEISRSISFYRSQQQGSQPARVFLCGGTTSLPYMREFFAEKLNLPIEYFNSLRNVSVGADVNMEEAGKSAHLLGELVGLSLRSTTDCPMELNLQPASVARAQKISEKRPYFVMAGACLLLVLLGWWLYFAQAAKVEAQVMSEINPKVAGLKDYEGKFAAVRQQIKAAQTTATPYTEAVADRDYWLKIIDDLNARLPARYIWITNFEPCFVSQDGKYNPIIGETGAASPPQASKAPGQQAPPQGIKIRGLYLENPNEAGVIDDYLKNLAQSPFFTIDLNKRTEVNPVRATPTSTEWAYDYELHLLLKKPISPQ